LAPAAGAVDARSTRAPTGITVARRLHGCPRSMRYLVIRRRHMAIDTPIQSEAGRSVRTIRNYIGGQWVASTATELLDVANPATGETIARVPLSTAEEVDRAARAAQDAFLGWRDTPPLDR